MNEYVAIIKQSRQISPDDWEVFSPVMKLTDETTIGEIRSWYLSFINLSPVWSIEEGKVIQQDTDALKICGITISQMGYP